MNNNELSTSIQNAKEHLKVLFDNHRHSVNIIHEDYVLAEIGIPSRFLRERTVTDIVEIHDGTIYYYIDSVIHSTLLSELLNADIDFMFNLYVLVPDKLWSTLVYIKCENEYFKFKSNRLFNPVSIHKYLQDII